MSYISQNIVSEYLTRYSHYESGHQNREILLEDIRKIFPFDNKPLRKHTWSIQEAVFIYYELNPNIIFSTLDFYSLGPLLQAIDSEYIRDLLIDHLGHKVCPAKDCVMVSEFVPFLEEKNVPIPPHLHMLSDNKIANIEPELDQQVTTMDDNILKKSIKSFDLKKFSVKELAILQARIIAAARWKIDNSLSQTEIVDDSNFRTQIENRFIAKMST